MLKNLEPNGSSMRFWNRFPIARVLEDIYQKENHYWTLWSRVFQNHFEWWFENFPERLKYNVMMLLINMLLTYGFLSHMFFKSHSSTNYGGEDDFRTFLKLPQGRYHSRYFELVYALHVVVSNKKHFKIADLVGPTQPPKEKAQMRRLCKTLQLADFFEIERFHFFGHCDWAVCGTKGHGNQTLPAAVAPAVVAHFPGIAVFLYCGVPLAYIYIYIYINKRYSYIAEFMPMSLLYWNWITSRSSTSYSWCNHCCILVRSLLNKWQRHYKSYPLGCPMLSLWCDQRGKLVATCPRWFGHSYCQPPCRDCFPPRHHPIHVQVRKSGPKETWIRSWRRHMGLVTRPDREQHSEGCTLRVALIMNF